MDRRSFLKTAGAATAAAWAGPARGAAARKPNLLVIWTDEQRADTMAVYGNRRIRADNLNKLAGESVVFEHAYVSQPVCTPSRSTVLTGLWPHQSGVTRNNVALPETAQTLPERVGDPEYRTGYFGKWHLGDEVFAQQGFHEWQSIEDTYWSYYREGRDIDRKSDYCQWLKSLGYRPDTDRDDFSRGFASRLPIEHCKPAFLERQTCDFLRRHRDRPFMLYVNFLEPHMPFTGPLNDLHSPDDIALPANFDDPLEENEPESYRTKAQGFLEQPYSTGLDLNRESDWRTLVGRYWGLVSQVDRSVGVILETLEELGLADNTIVVFTSDHGDMMGSHRMVEKSVSYQEAVRVPWLMRVPSQGRKHHMVKGHVSHIDLVPTLLDLMGAERRDDLPGRSLVPVMRGEEAAAAPVFIEWNTAYPLVPGRNPGGALRDTSRDGSKDWRAVVTPDGWKLCIHSADRGQLYDLGRDPGETVNLFDRPEHQATVTRLRNTIETWQADVGDSAS